MRPLRLFFLRRLGPIGIAMTVYEVWRRLPARQRRSLLVHGRRQGLRVATRAWAFDAGTIAR